MRQRAYLAGCAMALSLCVAWTSSPAQSVDRGVIRLQLPKHEDSALPDKSASKLSLGEPRRGFDVDSFEARLESLWFQHKALLADGRYDDVIRQSQAIRAFCTEEGIRRVESLAAALLVEARGFLDDGQHGRALDSLDLAEVFDPGRSQIHVARAAVLWESERRWATAAGQLVLALKSALVRSVRDLSLFNELAIVLVAALIGALGVFSILMLARYQRPFRHEIEEWTVHFVGDRWGQVAGWAFLFLPLLLWFAAGWIALYWVVITFRFMRPAERVSAIALLLATVLSVPAYRMAVTIYGMTADPAVRTTVAASGGEYDPDHVLQLQQLVEDHPEDASYRFLLAGVYKNGRYFEEAFAEYKKALEINPSLEQAYVNIGNIFYSTGQYGEAAINYRKALEINPNSILPYFNMHLAQSEAFHFKEAEESLERARQIDAGRLGDMLASMDKRAQRPTVIDASLRVGSLWQAAIEGRTPLQPTGSPGAGQSWLVRQLLNPISVVGLSALLLCGASWVMRRRHSVARCCIRCGRAFCRFCKSDRDAHEYCSQCLHLYVLGDGLAAENKVRKQYEVDRYEKLSRSARRIASLFFPGTAQLLRGRAIWGTLLLLSWMGAWIAWRPQVLTPFERLGGVDLRLDLLRLVAVPTMFHFDPFALLALLSIPAIWLMGNASSLRRRTLS